MKGANEILLEYRIQAITDHQVVDWGCEALLSDDLVSNDIILIQLVELKGIDSTIWKRKPDHYLQKLVEKYYADFKIPSFETELYARRALREKCADYLSGKNKLVEVIFTVAGEITKHFDNPDWVGNLLEYRNCDLNAHQSIDFRNEIIYRLQQL
jgi:hypothetical protein